MESRKVFITSLVSKMYDKYDFLRKESLDALINKALITYQNCDLSNEEIEDRLFQEIIIKKKEFDFRYDPLNVKNNHELVYKKLKEIVSLLNKNKIDYQLCGALAGYVKYNIESTRVHNDIDFNINEKDIDRFKQICISLGYKYEDNRLNPKRVLKNGIPTGEHEIIARDTNSNLDIGVFLFERLPDHSIINKFYFTDEQGNSCIKEVFYSPELAKEIFSRESVIFQGENIIITPPEYVYSLKEYTLNEKDLYDIDFLKDKIDKTKYKRIKKKFGLGKIVRIIHANKNESNNIYNPFNDSYKEDSICEMTAPGIISSTKRETSDDEGYTNSLIIILLTMVCLGFLIMSIIITRTLG